MSDNDAEDFIKELSVSYEGVEEEVQIVAQRLSLSALSSLVLSSPVDTGRFRANWTASLNTINFSTTTDTDRGGSKTISKESALISKAEPFQVVNITNSLPYADRLENGHSAQAPGGMVAITFSNLQAELG